ncbi:hypothetical protein E2C01_080966 [Portunus trituberculatus]|uniref:Uncharacterized protein n=1 Tax=Portunus trituberculatus TaxID=210409 RepID=A0A5B7INM0_PORTR|nr:hypothetical protein [Portunus trituberculatus]
MSGCEEEGLGYLAGIRAQVLLIGKLKRPRTRINSISTLSSTEVVLGTLPVISVAFENGRDERAEFQNTYRKFRLVSHFSLLSALSYPVFSTSSWNFCSPRLAYASLTPCPRLAHVLLTLRPRLAHASPRLATPTPCTS